MAQSSAVSGNPASRNGILLTVAVVLLLIAGVVIYRTYRATQPHVVANFHLPPGSSPKGAYLKEHHLLKGDGPTAGAPAADPSDLNPAH